MKTETEKQILEWREELDKQKKTKEQAELVLERATKTIDMIEVWIQLGEMLLKKNDLEGQPSNTKELGQESEKAPSEK